MLGSLFLVAVTSALPQSAPVAPSTAVSGDLNFLVLGDWGAGRDRQKSLAKTMNTFAEKRGSSFLLATGDNFYEFGVRSTTDRKWKDDWKDVYTGYVGQIPWYAILGNHDWYGEAKAQIDYTKVDKQWVMPDHFYTRVEQVGSKTAAFVYVDTDLFNYGYNCFGFECALINFRKYGWTRENDTLEKQFQWVEEQFKKYNDADYLFVVGHHNVGICGGKNSMPRFLSLMEKYNVSAYTFGHEHFLGYKQSKNTLLVVSGAGGKKQGPCGGEDWAAGDLYGFVNIRVAQNEFEVEFINEQGSIIKSKKAAPRN